MTVSCTTESAQVIKINSNTLLSKLRPESMDELIKVTQSKLEITQRIIDSYKNFEVEQYKTSKKDKLTKTVWRNSAYLYDQPTHIAVKISMDDTLRYEEIKIQVQLKIIINSTLL